MSRIRSIHPGLWTDEGFVSLSSFARLLLIGMWNECDDVGLFVWSPLQLKMRILPADNTDAAALLAEIEDAGFIRRYEVDGKAYGGVKNFRKFQRPKKPNSIHPQTAQILAFVATSTEPDEGGAEAVPHQLPTDGGKPPQREEGGDKMEEIKAAPNGACASGDALTPAEIVEEWNVLAKATGLSSVRTLTDQRKRALKVRLREYPDITDWQRAFAHIRASPFLRGENKTGWRADFDFLLQAKSFTKLTEAAYGQT